MFQTNVQISLWDLVDEGVDSVLDRLAGESGATGVSLGVVQPATAWLRPHPNVAPRTFRSDGGLQFQPGKDLYAATRIRPVTADWLRKSNPLSAVAQGCAERALTLRGRVDCCHTRVHASRFEFCAAKDLFGDVHPAWLCPSNPDVREFLGALVADLSTHYPFESLELNAVWFPPAGSWKAGRSMCQHMGTAGEWLLSLCFCESCRQAAGAEGLDAASAARSAAVFVERCLATGDPLQQSFVEILQADPILRSYAHWRTTQVTRLVGYLREACSCRLLVVRHSDTPATGLDPRAIPRQHDVALVMPPAGADDIESGIREALADTGDPARVEVGVSACPPDCPDSAALVRALSTAVRMGVGAASVSDYGLLPLNRLAWIKQASRYAQRESE